MNEVLFINKNFSCLIPEVLPRMQSILSIELGTSEMSLISSNDEYFSAEDQNHEIDIENA